MFYNLPDEMLKLIFNHLHNYDLRFFSQSSLAMYKKSYDELQKRKKEKKKKRKKIIIYACRLIKVNYSDLTQYNNDYFEVIIARLNKGQGKNFSSLQNALEFVCSSKSKFDICQISIPFIHSLKFHTIDSSF